MADPFNLTDVQEEHDKMFEARLAKTATLKKVVDVIKDLITETNLDCNEEGISLQGMEASHVALVSLQLNAAAFDAYRCDRSVSLGISFKSLSTVLKCAANEDTCTIKAQDESPDTMELMFEASEAERVSDFELKLMDIDSEHLKIPESEYTAVIKMPSSEFKRIVTDLQVIGETVILEVNKSGASFQVSGDIGKGNVCLHSDSSADNENAVKIEMTEPIKMTYALRYLNNFAKAGSLTDTVTLQMRKDLPLNVVFELEKGDHGCLQFYLAPKIGDDEEETNDGNAADQADDADMDDGDAKVKPEPSDEVVETAED